MHIFDHIWTLLQPILLFFRPFLRYLAFEIWRPASGFSAGRRGDVSGGLGCQVQLSWTPSSDLTFPGTVTATRRPSDWPSVTLKSHKITRKTNTGGRCVCNRRGLGVRLPAGLPRRRRRRDAAATLRQGTVPASWRGAPMHLTLQWQQNSCRIIAGVNIHVAK